MEQILNYVKLGKTLDTQKH